MDEKEKRGFVMRLSGFVDPLAFAEYVAKATKYGKHPHKEAWGHTRRFLQQYGDPTEEAEYIRLWEAEGIHDEMSAARWVLKNEKDIP